MEQRERKRLRLGEGNFLFLEDAGDGKIKVWARRVDGRVHPKRSIPVVGQRLWLLANQLSGGVDVHAPYSLGEHIDLLPSTLSDSIDILSSDYGELIGSVLRVPFRRAVAELLGLPVPTYSPSFVDEATQ